MHDGGNCGVKRAAAEVIAALVTNFPKECQSCIKPMMESVFAALSKGV